MARRAPLEVTHKGGCHCGAVRFEVRAPARIGVEDCNCSICRKTGFLHLIVDQADFTLLQGNRALATYRFNTGAAEHIFCKFCGIHSYGVPRVRPDRITVNARCLDNVERAVLTPSRFFDGQNWEEAAKRYLATEKGRAR